MNFKKTFAGIAAAAVAAVSVSAAAGAELVKIETPKDADGKEYVCSDSSMFLTIGYFDGSRSQDATKAVVDYGVDWSKAASVAFTFHITEDTQADFAEGENGIGGAVIVSSNSATDTSHNWNAKDWWGVNDEDLGFTAESAKALQANKVGDYTYELVCPIDDTNSVVDDAVIVQIALQDWSGVVWWQAVIDKVSVNDASGAELISWDGAGNCSLTPGTPANASAPVETVAAPAAVPGANITIEDNVVTYTKDDMQGVSSLLVTYSAEEDAVVKLGACASTNDWAWTELEMTLPAGENQTYEIKMSDVLGMLGATDASELGDVAKLYNAGGEATFTGADVKLAAKAGDVAAATDSSKGSPDTGIEDVAVVAGLAAVAAGAIVVAKKRK